MVKHLPGNEDLDILIDDAGGLFIFCKELKKGWAGTLKLEAFELPKSPSEATAIAQTPGAGTVMRKLAQSNQSVLAHMGFRSDVIDALRALARLCTLIAH